MYLIHGRGSFCFNYCLNSAWHGGDQFVALLRWYGSPGFFDSDLQLICIFWSVVSHFPLDNTPLILYGVQVWWVCWPVKHGGYSQSHCNLKVVHSSTQPAASMHWVTEVTDVNSPNRHTDQCDHLQTERASAADDIAPQIITDCGNLTLDFKQLGLWASPPFLQTLGPWFPNETQNLFSSEKRSLDFWATVQFFSLAQVRRLWWQL